MRIVGWLALTGSVWIAGCASAPSFSRGAARPAAGGGPPIAPQEPPGAYLADVTQATISTTICVPGWTATVRDARADDAGCTLLHGMRRTGASHRVRIHAGLTGTVTRPGNSSDHATASAFSSAFDRL